MQSLETGDNAVITGPVSYGESLVLQKNARAVLTDSGGIQKEAYILGKPCLTLRNETEWVETVDAGWNLLVGTEPSRIIDGLKRFSPECDRPSLSGDGLASQKIASILTGGVPAR